jgi:hypothetical protein
LIEKPGKYTVKAVSRGGLPASNDLVITVADGQLSDNLKLFAAIQKAVPAGWRAAIYGQAIVLLNTPTRLKADATSVTLFFTKQKDSGTAKAEYVADTKLGHAWIQTQSPQAAERWPDYEKFLRQHLDAFKK